ncbi:branched-chain amino acid ABC transporter permease [Halobellus limi]|jgi:ABC-type branched-subunit amino acid transport system permease subunit|uniref:ABC-type branched-chain amino acid transport system, permease component n=1 Tax=Halobellus limi TaxID=699433 RepID=A0A1H6AZP4_9EURY|nr:branched-chain amino acid ABC transporter permease [Halobellus limi]QCC47838.1 branched-chain amino acid ABC transporter permease [Halobellus limi]SEG54039.1 ABC-type branched-chain amino acid transport system, permease component [Halobellus limi]
MNRTGADALTRDRLTTAVVFAALLAVPFLFFDPATTYISRRFIRVMIFAIFAMALNIVFGETDQLILFMGGIAAVGAYTTALTAQYLGISPWITLLLGAFVAGVFGSIVCYVAARRQFTVIVLAIVTFAFQMIISEVLVGLRDITRGSTGFPFNGLQLPAVEQVTGLGSYAIQFYVLLAIFAAVLGVYTWLNRSKYGLAFDAIRQDEFAARATGVDVVRLKVFAGFISTFIIGLVGPFYGQTTGIIIPSLFSFNSVDVLVLIILVLGGLRSRYGPLVGAAVIIYIDNLLGNFGQWRTVAFGLLLTVLFLYFRDGIVPSITSLYDDREGLRKRLGGLRSGD